MSANKSKRGLGRGFDSLIPDNLLDEAFDPTAEQDTKLSQLKEVSIDEIFADEDQPRKVFSEEAIEELASSIREHGVLQPIVLTPRKQGGFTIVAGERRFRASKQAELKTIPSIIRTLTNQHKLELSLIENVQRQDLNVLELATAYTKLKDQFNLTLEDIGARVGKSFSAISNTMRLLKLPKFVQDAVFEGKLTEGQARPLIGLDSSIVEKRLSQIIDEDWTARKIEAWAKAQKFGKDSAVKSAPVSPVYNRLTKSLTTRFGTPVAIKANARGAGKITISFKSKTEFERIQRLFESE